MVKLAIYTPQNWKLKVMTIGLYYILFSYALTGVESGLYLHFMNPKNPNTEPVQFEAPAHVSVAYLMTDPVFAMAGYMLLTKEISILHPEFIPIVLVNFPINIRLITSRFEKYKFLDEKVEEHIQNALGSGAIVASTNFMSARELNPHAEEVYAAKPASLNAMQIRREKAGAVAKRKEEAAARDAHRKALMQVAVAKRQAISTDSSFTKLPRDEAKTAYEWEKAQRLAEAERLAIQAAGKRKPKRR